MRNIKREIFIFTLLLITACAVIGIGVFLFNDEKFYLISVMIALLGLAAFFAAFERKNISVREIVSIASMTAIAVAGRAAFYMLPQVKPTCAIVIITAVAFGGEAGFITGAAAMLISNFFFGQGAWTPFQMFGMGLTGFICGMIFEENRLRYNKWVLSIAGGLICFAVYGLIVDTNSALMMASDGNFKTVLSVYISGLPFNAVHGATTAVILFLAGKPMLEKMDRLKMKYGIFERRVKQK